MSAGTEISWTDATWNPIRGCSMAKGSETGGCLNCYAARLNARELPGLKSPTTGKPFARILESGPRWTGDVELIESQLLLPLKWRKPRRIFVNSMSDLFHENLPIAVPEHIFRVALSAPQHTYQILTKRAELMAERVPQIMNRIFGPHWKMPEFIWLGVSVEDQKTADARIPLLLRAPAAKRFVSYEPALEPVDFSRRWMKPNPYESVGGSSGYSFSGLRGNHPELMTRLDWVIVGGESGPGARPFNVQWARNTIEQCREAGVASFCKQLGAHVIDTRLGLECLAICGWPFGSTRTGTRVRLKDRKGGDMSEWPQDLRVREFPA